MAVLPLPTRTPNVADTTGGQFVTETCEYDDSRQVTVEVPPHPADAIVFAGDGCAHNPPEAQ